MEKSEFLAKNVFKGLKSESIEVNNEEAMYFSEVDFEIILQKVEHFGIGIYTIETRLGKEVFETQNHEKNKKKATDAKWYNKAFMTLRKRQEGLLYSASYKVSQKLLDRS